MNILNSTASYLNSISTNYRGESAFTPSSSTNLTNFGKISNNTSSLSSNFNTHRSSNNNGALALHQQESEAAVSSSINGNLCLNAPFTTKYDEQLQLDAFSGGFSLSRPPGAGLGGPD